MPDAVLELSQKKWGHPLPRYFLARGLGIEGSMRVLSLMEKRKCRVRWGSGGAVREEFVCVVGVVHWEGSGCRYNSLLSIESDKKIQNNQMMGHLFIIFMVGPMMICLLTPSH